jgi:esterase/lipase superfamily enzyme
MTGRVLRGFAAALALLGAACAETWPDAAHVWVERGCEAFEAATPAAERRPAVDVLYVTDREVDAETPEGPSYGFGRSRFVACGVAAVAFDPPITWDGLLTATCEPRAEGPPLRPVVATRREIARFGRGPGDLEVRDGRLVPKEATLTRETAARALLGAELERRLAGAERRDVFLFVHGFNNTFDDAVLRLAAFWHACGRPGVALAHAWPAGYGGLFGYTYDRESGEFTVRHLKDLLLFLGACPAVERVHLVAHSRGVDVAVTALRELHLVAEGRGAAARTELKLATVVLAAPDLDVDVFDQRFLKERLYEAANRTTIYVNPGDSAIGLAKWLFSSRRRVGAFRVEDVEPEAGDHLAKLPEIELVQCAVTGRSGGHDYVFRDPAALSDLVLLLRDHARAGSAARPLLRHGKAMWRLENDYLQPPRDLAASRPARRRLDF